MLKQQRSQMKQWATLDSGRCPFPWKRVGTRWSWGSHPNHSVILWSRNQYFLQIFTSYILLLHSDKYICQIHLYTTYFIAGKTTSAEILLHQGTGKEMIHLSICTDLSAGFPSNNIFLWHMQDALLRSAPGIYKMVYLNACLHFHFSLPHEMVGSHTAMVKIKILGIDQCPASHARDWKIHEMRGIFTPSWARITWINWWAPGSAAINYICKTMHSLEYLLNILTPEPLLLLSLCMWLLWQDSHIMRIKADTVLQ